MTRAARYGVRRALTLARKTGLPVTVPERGFHPDWPAWRAPDVRDQMTATILRPDSIAADIFGRDRVAETNHDVLALLALAEQLQEVILTYGDRNVIEAARRKGLIPPD